MHTGIASTAVIKEVKIKCDIKLLRKMEPKGVDSLLDNKSNRWITNLTAANLLEIKEQLIMQINNTTVITA